MIQLEELKSKLLELKPQIDDYRSAIGMDDLVKKQQELEEKTADPNFWNDLENSSQSSATNQPDQRERSPPIQRWKATTKTWPR